VNNFPCTKCGACCQRAGAAGLMPSKADGSCLYLNTDNTCSVYDKRPDFCSIDKMYKKRQLIMSKKDYYKLTAKICNKFIEEDGLDDKFKIDLKIFDH
jgi:Fe-S-cluster containining protein